MDETKVQLSYGAPKRWYSRRWVRRLTLAAITLVIAIGAIVYCAPQWRRANRDFWLARCLEYAPPAPDYKVIDRGGRGDSADDDWYVDQTQDTTVRLRREPECWSRLSKTDFFSNAPSAGAVLFLHTMRKADGPELLICVMRPLGAVGGLTGWDVLFIPLSPSASTPITRSSGGVHNANDLLAGDSTVPVQIYAGVADPHDPSRFTIKYGINGETGTIEGQLEDLKAEYKGQLLAVPNVYLRVVDGPGAAEE